MDVVEINLEKGIKWPPKCAYCNEGASTDAKTHFRVIDGFFLIAIRETTHTVEYPVCDRHKWPAKFYGFVTNQAWPTGFVMVLTFPFLLSIPLLFGTVANGKYDGQILVAAYVLFLVWVIYLKVRNPVKIVKAKKSIARFRFANQDYAAEFGRANSEL